MEFIYQSASIEASEAEIISRDIKLSSWIEIPNIGRCRKYNCKRNSEATIEVELNPKVAKHKSTSHLNLNDKLLAEEVVVLINSSKEIKKEIVNHSGRHKAQKVKTKAFTYAEISMQFPNIIHINDPKQLPPKPKEIGF